jgi:hypothetical protein
MTLSAIHTTTSTTTVVVNHHDATAPATRIA